MAPAAKTQLSVAISHTLSLAQYLFKAVFPGFLAVQLLTGCLDSGSSWALAAQNFMENERVAPKMRF